jgi:hypothetical protein
VLQGQRAEESDDGAKNRHRRDEYLQKFGQYLIDLDDRLDKDPWVHQIHTHELVTTELRSIGCEEGPGT